MHGFIAAVTRIQNEIGAAALLSVDPARIAFHNHPGLTKTGQNGAAWTIVYLDRLALAINRDSLLGPRSRAAVFDAHGTLPTTHTQEAEALADNDAEHPPTINLLD